LYGAVVLHFIAHLGVALPVADKIAGFGHGGGFAFGRGKAGNGQREQ